jgi:Xaa-Pro aminopeptidase
VTVRLERVGAPPLLVPDERPAIPAAEYEERLRALEQRVEADVVVAYGDREHFANLSFLCGFDPRFEEALLVLAEGRRSLVVGTEGLSLASLVPVDVEVVHCPSLGLMGQDRSTGSSLGDALREAGVGGGARVGIAGWKYFEPGEDLGLAAASFVVEALRELSDEIFDATPALMNPHDGLRVVSGADQIVAFEWSAARASRAVVSIVEAAAPGVSELEAVSAMGYEGDPLSAHVMFSSGPEVAVGLRSPTGRRLELGDAATTAVGFWGGLSCRAGLIESTPRDHEGPAADYLHGMAVPYWSAIAVWYESLELGRPGGEVDREARGALAGARFGPALNPGHLIHLDEWVHTPIRPDSTEPIRSGMCFQCDIIPDAAGPGRAANCEDTLAVADAALRDDLAARHGPFWERVQARRTFMRDTLGIALAEEVLPLSAAPAWFPPFWLSTDHALVRS